MNQPRYNVAERYTALLSAGEELFCDEYDLAKPKLIAEKAGVSVGLFYRHFKNKREMLTEIMVQHLNILHSQIETALKQDLEVETALYTVLILTMEYFQQHQQIIKLFFLEVGYGDFVATAKLSQARQTYRCFLKEIIEKGIKEKIFLDAATLDVELAINSIIGTINWSIYELLIVQNKSLEAKSYTKRLLPHVLRSLTLPLTGRQSKRQF